MGQLYCKGGLPISQCQQCGLVQANPRLSQEEIWQRYSPNYFWEEYMPAHGAANGEYNQALHRARNLHLIKLLAPFKQNGRLLEVGCAAGFMLKVAHEEGWQVQGVELMESAVAYAQEKLNLDVQAGTLGEAQFEPQSFDGVAMIETVEHLLDPTAVLLQVHELLRPGGGLLVAVPNQASLMKTLLGESWSILSPAEHLYYFTAETMEALLKKVGFKTVTFVWQLSGQPAVEILNPHHSNTPHSMRSRMVRLGTQVLLPLLLPLVCRTHQTDRLVCLAQK